MSTNPVTVQHTIGFFAPSNATPEQVVILLDDIHRYFGLTPATIEGFTPQEVVTAQAPAQLATSVGVELDSANTPWDERIHSSSKSKTAKGIWTKRKNVSDADFNRILAEITLAAGSTPTSTPAPTLAPPPAPTPTLAPPPVAAPQQSEFQKLLLALGKHSDLLNQDWLDQSAAAYGISGGFANLAHAPDAKVIEIRDAIATVLTGAGRTL